MITRLGAVAATAVLALTPAVVPANASVAEPTVIADGHVDLGPRFADGGWVVQLRDDTVRPAVWRDLSQVVLHAVDAAKVTVPPDPAFAFLGPAGATVWVLPQVQRPGILWPGWNTQDPSVIATVNREATWRLRGISGPGHFALFLNGGFGAPEIVFDSTRPYPQETGVEAGAHVHGNWTFSAPGTYLLEIEMVATTVAGVSVADRETLRIFVGPGDPTEAVAAIAPSGTPEPTTQFAQPVHITESSAAGPAATSWIVAGVGGLVAIVVVLLALRRVRARRAETST